MAAFLATSRCCCCSRSLDLQMLRRYRSRWYDRVLIEWVATKQGDDALVGGPAGGVHGLNGPDLADVDGFAVGFALVEIAQIRVWERLVYYH